MTNPPIDFCPVCGTLKAALAPKVRCHEDVLEVKYSNYLGCECNALTYSPGNRTYNLREDVAKKWFSKPSARPSIHPTIRRN